MEDLTPLTSITILSISHISICSTEGWRETSLRTAPSPPPTTRTCTKNHIRRYKKTKTNIWRQNASHFQHKSKSNCNHQAVTKSNYYKDVGFEFILTLFHIRCPILCRTRKLVHRANGHLQDNCCQIHSQCDRVIPLCRYGYKIIASKSSQHEVDSYNFKSQTLYLMPGS